MNEKTRFILFRSLYKMLKPMVRLLMRHGVHYSLFADTVRYAYIDVAREDFALPGRKPSLSRMAVLTGINRKVIARFLERPHPLSGKSEERQAPIARVITGWLNDKSFQSAEGAPAQLPIEEQPKGPSFTQLVRKHGRDLTPRAVLDELERIGAVVRRGERAQLVTQGYIPLADLQESIRIFGTSAADLMATMDHNISGQSPGPYIQRAVSYHNIPQELLDDIRQRCAQEGQAFLLQVNDWLSECDQEAGQGSGGQARAGIGLYYFEDLEPSAAEQAQIEQRQKADKGEL